MHRRVPEGRVFKSPIEAFIDRVSGTLCRASTYYRVGAFFRGEVAFLVEPFACCLRFGDHAGCFFRQPGALAQLRRDLGNLLRRIIGREYRRLWRQIARRNALGRFVDDVEIFTRFRIRTVEDRGELLEVTWREAVEAKVVATVDVRLHSGIFSVGIRGVGNIFIRLAPVRFSIARAYAIW